MTKSNDSGNKPQKPSVPQKPSQPKQPSKPEQRNYSEGGKIYEVNGTGPRSPKSTKK